MNKTVLQVLVIYFAVAGLIFASDWLSTQRLATDEKIVPFMFSVVLLVPLFVWYRSFRKRAVLSRQVGKAETGAVLISVFALFFLAMVVRLPSMLLFKNVYEKTPLIYLVVLTIILVKKESLGLYGFRTKRFEGALIVGLIYYLVYELSGFFALSAMTFAYAGQPFYVGYNPAPALLVFPFMTFCVGISEEALFRGFMQTRLSTIYSWKRAVLIQAVLFGLWHFVWHLSPLDFGGMILHISSTFLFGLVFGYFYHISENLTPLILAHGLVDSVPYGLIKNSSLAFEESPFLLMGIIAFIVSIVALAVSTRCLAKRIENPSE
jgi:membrane protease YdiL (CAAX protease family)